MKRQRWIIVYPVPSTQIYWLLSEFDSKSGKTRRLLLIYFGIKPLILHITLPARLAGTTVRVSQQVLWPILNQIHGQRLNIVTGAAPCWPSYVSGWPTVNQWYTWAVLKNTRIRLVTKYQEDNCTWQLTNDTSPTNVKLVKWKWSSTT